MSGATLPLVDQTASQDALHALALASGRLVIATDGEDRLREERTAVLNALKDYERATATTPPIPSGTEERLTRSPAQFFFEVGFGACWAEAFVRNDVGPFPLNGAIIERAWEIAGEAHDDPEEFDAYLVAAALPSVSQEEITQLEPPAGGTIRSEQDGSRAVVSGTPPVFEATAHPSQEGISPSLVAAAADALRVLKGSQACFLESHCLLDQQPRLDTLEEDTVEYVAEHQAVIDNLETALAEAVGLS